MQEAHYDGTTSGICRGILLVLFLHALGIGIGALGGLLGKSLARGK